MKVEKLLVKSPVMYPTYQECVTGLIERTDGGFMVHRQGTKWSFIPDSNVREAIVIKTEIATASAEWSVERSVPSPSLSSAAADERVPTLSETVARTALEQAKRRRGRPRKG